ncbi:glycosyltransferase family 4 protein [Cytobacillus firmus]|uniref:glycosyltransferase family 4 protein n=1 Tax=Cytobacillus firmus TaxID=1399 RepID=UPI0018CED98B|nr:glycosyltransferase family 4 protein [Cytobacillus firmus]MBG9444257.1 glycosyltransferase [Cytobacillus firmus]
MRVIFLRSNPVDPDSRVEKEVNSLVKAGYEVEIIAWDRSEKYKNKGSYINLESGRVKITRFGIPATFGGGIKKNLIPLIVFQIKLFYWLYKNKNNFDIIHACDFDTAYMSNKIANKFNKKFVYDIFDYYVDSFSVPKLIKKFIEKKDHQIINSADAVIICSEKRKEQIKGTNPKQLFVIHNTPSKVAARLNEFNLNKAKNKICYVGILGEGRLIKEMARIISKRNDCEFHCAGFGILEDEIKELAKRYDNIYFYGKISYRKSLELASKCDIMTALYDPGVPNNYYAAPNKFYEALMLGKPLIMVRNTGMSEIIKEESIGALTEYNEDSLSKALTRVIERKEEWPWIQEKMKKIYKDKYRWELMKNKLLKLYRGI